MEEQGVLINEVAKATCTNDRSIKAVDAVFNAVRKSCEG